MEFGFPELTESFLSGQDVLYQQFNDVNFYVEDVDQEHFYFNILSKLFTNLKFEKIFPLGGKKDVIDAAKESEIDTTKVYIVDLDFDEILGAKENLENLFYLDRYCIENHLLDRNAVFELIREKNPSLKNIQIASNFDFDRVINETIQSLTELATMFVLVKKFNLNTGFYGIVPARDFNFKLKPPFYNRSFVRDYCISVENSLKTVKRSYSLTAQAKKLKKFFNSKDNAVKNIPGKYLLTVLKYRLESETLTNQVSLSSFTYKLSKETTELRELEYLQNAIAAFFAK